MKKSLVDRIIAFLRNNEGKWFNSGELEMKAAEIGFKPSTCGRRLRELAETGIIERQEKKGHRAVSVWYRAVSKSVLVTKAEDGRILATEKVW